jgi:hypothetical protein
MCPAARSVIEVGVRYDLVATEKETAKREAEQYLDEYPVIEVWSDDHRLVARLVSKSGRRLKTAPG